MEEKIKLTCGDGIENSIEILNKLKTKQRLLELFETEEIEKIDVIYKKREPACKADSKN